MDESAKPILLSLKMQRSIRTFLHVRVEGTAAGEINGVVACKKRPVGTGQLGISSWRQRRCYVPLRTRTSSPAIDPASNQERLADDDDRKEEKDRLRKIPQQFQPSIWGDFFLYYSNPLASSAEQIRIVERADKLKEVVAKMIASSSTHSQIEMLHLIDMLQRLCLDHLFQDEIDVVLSEIHDADINGCTDLHTAALRFYLLRKHGFNVSPNVFSQFHDEEGCFASSNPMDLLCLYNAAYLRTHGETILDEAISFTKRCLKSALPHLEGSLALETQCALDIPLPRRVRIYEANCQIRMHEKETSTNKMILELAKLNYNLMQLQYQQELKIITRWWKDLEIQSRLSFARDRIVECYFWIVGVYFEPCYARSRIILTKVIAIVTLLDDIYDVYGTSEECELFTKCMESWDPKASQDLPEYMKFVFGKIFDTYEAMEHELTHTEKSRMFYLRNFTIDLVRAFNNEVKWRDAGYVPSTVEEHLRVSTRTGGCYILSCASFVGMDCTATEKSFDWVSSRPKIVQALCKILRLSDDLKTYEREQMTSHVASTIDSYMKEHNVSYETACENIQEHIEESWKDFNGEWLATGNVQPKQLVERIFNLARTMEFMYNQHDKFTNCQNLQDDIRLLFVEAFTIT